MTKEEIIVHWKSVVNAVFLAENNVNRTDAWKNTLKKARGTDECERIKDAYVTAVAMELLKGYTEKELKELYQ